MGLSVSGIELHTPIRVDERYYQPPTMSFTPPPILPSEFIPWQGPTIIIIGKNDTAAPEGLLAPFKISFAFCNSFALQTNNFENNLTK